MVSSNGGHPNHEEWLSWSWIWIDLNILWYVPATRRCISQHFPILLSATSWSSSYCRGVFVQQATFWLARLAGATEFVEEQADCNLLYQSWNLHFVFLVALPGTRHDIAAEVLQWWKMVSIHLKFSCSSFLCLWTILCFCMGPTEHRLCHSNSLQTPLRVWQKQVIHVARAWQIHHDISIVWDPQCSLGIVRSSQLSPAASLSKVLQGWELEMTGAVLSNSQADASGSRSWTIHGRGTFWTYFESILICDMQVADSSLRSNCHKPDGIRSKFLEGAVGWGCVPEWMLGISLGMQAHTNNLRQISDMCTWNWAFIFSKTRRWTAVNFAL